jgi:hypothetical protein
MLAIKRLIPVAALMATVGGLYAPAALASSNQEAIIQDDAMIKADPAGTLATYRSLGVTRVRLSVTWNTLAPSPNSKRAPSHFKGGVPTSYAASKWAIYDAIVRQAKADGIALDFLLTGGAPRWANGPGMPSGTHPQWKPNAVQFGAFAKAVGTRYSGHYKPNGQKTALPRISFYSIWNEPNYGFDLAPQTSNHDSIEVGAAIYRGLLQHAWAGLAQSGHKPGRDTILIGETAPRGLDHGIGNFQGVKPLRFIRALYCVDSSYHELRGFAASARGCPTTAGGSRSFRRQNPALFSASGFADHPYTSQARPVAPNVPTSLVPGSHRSDPDFADLPEVPRLEGVLDHLNRIYGSHTHYNIWNTEYAYRTRPPDPVGTSLSNQALWLNQGEYISYKERRISSFDQYLLVDPPGGSFASGLMTNARSPKPSFSAWAMPIFLPTTSTRKGRKIEVWGCARPAHFANGAQKVQIRFRSGSKGAFKTLTTTALHNKRGYFDVKMSFPSSGQVKTEWNGITSRTQNIRIR